MKTYRYLLRAGLFALTISSISTATLAQDSGRLPDGNNPAAYSGLSNSEFQSLQSSAVVRRNTDLRNEALRLQKKDGGELTPEHVRYLQGKLNRLKSE